MFHDWNDEIDSWKYVVIVRDKVPVHREANSKSKVIGLLSKEIVQPDRETDYSRTSDWVRVIQPNGQIGYVEERFAYSPIGYRAVIGKEGRSWKMPFFLGGD